MSLSHGLGSHALKYHPLALWDSAPWLISLADAQTTSQLPGIRPELIVRARQSQGTFAFGMASATTPVMPPLGQSATMYFWPFRRPFALGERLSASAADLPVVMLVHLVDDLVLGILSL